MNKQYTLASHCKFMLLAMLTMMMLFSLARVALYRYNIDLASALSAKDVWISFGIGLRFDLMVVSIFSVPLLAGFIFPASSRLRKFFIVWLSFVSSISIFFCIAELDFYREFHQRLNSLVFEYMKQDPKTVISMLWNGFPLFRYLLAWAVLSGLIYCFYRWLSAKTLRATQSELIGKNAAPWWLRFVLCVVVMFALVLGARGTLREGPPLRWGDAFHGQNLFANHLGLNGVFTLYKATRTGNGKTDKNFWLNAMPIEQATAIVKDLLLTPQDALVGGKEHPLLRTHKGSPITHAANEKKPNVVVILMESFSGVFTGALGNDLNITPSFDQIAKQGLLFTRFFSNGTHTHQGMFATFACFPNLPGYEYLMQEPEGTHKFSGLPLLLHREGYQNTYIYNGSFSWDNQEGFFRNQDVTKFIGRDDFVNPVFVNPTWGVSDQDMFDRSVTELNVLAKNDKPFFAMLQTLSNHTPYAMPTPLPVPAVTGQGILNEHLTAMRYADWALGQFFQKIEKEPWYNNTIFVLVGDHGFSTSNQVTDIDLLRFRVPLLIIGPKVRETFGATTDRVATQNDIAPTVMGLIGDSFTHQCWGRDVLSVKDTGFALIKPSGNDEIVGYVRDSHIVIKRPNATPELYRYDVKQTAHAELLNDEVENKQMATTLAAFVERATRSLLDNTAGAGQ